MWCKVLKPFPYAHDHHNVVSLEEGKVLEIDDGVVEGLAEEGFVAEASAEEIEAAQEGEVVLLAEPVDIPDDWAKLKAIPLRTLAAKIAGAAVASAPAAKAIIEAELAKRAA